MNEDEVVRLAGELVATADLSEPRGMTTTVSSDHLAELMEALELMSENCLPLDERQIETLPNLPEDVSDFIRRVGGMTYEPRSKADQDYDELFKAHQQIIRHACMLLGRYELWTDAMDHQKKLLDDERLAYFRRMTAEADSR